MCYACKQRVENKEGKERGGREENKRQSLPRQVQTLFIPYFVFPMQAEATHYGLLAFSRSG